MKELATWPHADTPLGYGDDTTYVKGMAFLEGLDIEDWGCARAYAKQFHKTGAYKGIDGTPSAFCDVATDLRTYRSQTPGLFMRHVLEHNYDWKKILENALASFQKRMVLILFTPFSDVTKEIATNNFYGTLVPDLSFRWKDLADLITHWRVDFPLGETCKTATQYQQEYIFYLEKDPFWKEP